MRTTKRHIVYGLAGVLVGFFVFSMGCTNRSGAPTTGTRVNTTTTRNPTIPVVPSSTLSPATSTVAKPTVTPTTTVGVTPIVGTSVEYDDVGWPTIKKVLSSTFGPRLQFSQRNRYEFHEGIDIPGIEGVDEVYAIADGEIFRTYVEGDPRAVRGGTMVILRHHAQKPIVFHGQKVDTYYSVYMHLDSLALQTVPEKGPYPSIRKGEKVGTVGKTGTTDFSHLHFEIRLGTYCTFDFQVQNPSSSCAKIFTTPTDPHVNPLLFLPYTQSGVIDVKQVRTVPLTVRVSVPRTYISLNTFIFHNGTQTKKIQFDTKAGIHPQNIDNPQFDGVTIVPQPFTTNSSHYIIEFVIDEWRELDQVEVLDVFGNGVRVEW